MPTRQATWGTELWRIFSLIFGAEGLALHDRIAGSRVVRAQRVYAALHAIRIVALLIAVGVVAFVGAKLGAPRKTAEVQPRAQPGSLASITRQIPAVLTIYCYDERARIAAQGSGFLISAHGVGITSFHVLESAHRAEAQLGDGRRYQVLAVRAFDADKDVVVLQLGRMIAGTAEWPENLPFLTMGSSKECCGR